MKRKSSTRRKKTKNQAKKKSEKLFVSKFLRQPGKTRSGIRYSKKKKGKSSIECIYGSLVTGANSSDGNSNDVHNSPQKANDLCSCKQCVENDEKEKISICGSSHDGLSILLSKDKHEPSVIAPSSCSTDKTSLLEVKEKEAKITQDKAENNIQTLDPEFCECSECCGYAKKSTSLSCCEDVSIASKRNVEDRYKLYKLPSHPLEHSLPKPKKRKFKRMKQSDYSFNKKKVSKKRKRAKREKNLLKYVLDKKRTVSDINVKSNHSAKQLNSCLCCSQCFTKLKNFIKQQISKQTNSTKRSTGVQHNCLQTRKRKTRKLRNENNSNEKESTERKDSSVRPSAGSESSEAYHETIDEKPPNYSNKLTNNILFPSAGKTRCKGVQNKSGSNVNVRRMVSSKSRWKPKYYKRIKANRCCNTKSYKTKDNSCDMSCINSESNENKAKPTYKKRSVTRWKLLSAQAIKKLKSKQTKRIKGGRNKKKISKPTKSSSNYQKDNYTAPVPSARKKKFLKKSETDETLTEEESLNSFTECNKAMKSDKLIKELVGKSKVPVPSGRVPTYIAMVKTAIRDLKAFRLTGKEAISKYIEIRYLVKNDDLLSYVLKWMVNMGVLKRKNGQYFFVGKRLVKKQTVAVLQACKKKRMEPQCFEECLPKRNYYQCRKRIKRQKHKRKPRCCSKKCKKKRYTCPNACKRVRCTCAKEMQAAKNRIKVRTRYVRKNGKIYKQEEFV